MTEPSKALKTNNRLNAIPGVQLRIRQEKNILRGVWEKEVSGKSEDVPGLIDDSVLH